MPQDETLGGLLRELRTNAKLNQRQLAKRVGITDSAIAQFEQGRRYPGDDTITRIATALGLTKRQTDRLRALKAAEAAPTAPDPVAEALLELLKLMRETRDQIAALHAELRRRP